MGLAGNDRLNGLAGNDLLDGGSGADSMAGGRGNDIYIVDNGGDRVVEKRGEGTDTVRQRQSYPCRRGRNIHRLGQAALNGSGNAGANQVTGNSARNTLSGGAGNDAGWR